MDKCCPTYAGLADYIRRRRLYKYGIGGERPNAALSPWVKLPAELRELIYVYVLTEPSGLVYCTGKEGMSRVCARQVQIACNKLPITGLLSSIYNRIPSRLRCPRIAAEEQEFNQIQYVSRRCYKEAHSLELRYNNILFEDSGDLSAGQRCQTFLSRMVGKKYAHDLKLSVRGSNVSPCETGHPACRDRPINWQILGRSL